MSFGYAKKDKLKSKKLIDQLFTEGKSVSAFPLRLVYLKTEFNDGSLLKTGVSVSKRLHKTAVSRNRIKRLMREAYRLNIPNYLDTNTASYAFMILYIGKEKTTFDALDSKMKKLLEKFMNNTRENEKISE